MSVKRGISTIGVACVLGLVAAPAMAAPDYSSTGPHPGAYSAVVSGPEAVGDGQVKYTWTVQLDEAFFAGIWGSDSSWTSAISNDNAGVDFLGYGDTDVRFDKFVVFDDGGLPDHVDGSGGSDTDGGLASWTLSADKSNYVLEWYAKPNGPANGIGFYTDAHTPGVGVFWATLEGAESFDPNRTAVHVQWGGNSAWISNAPGLPASVLISALPMMGVVLRRFRRQ